MGWVSKTWANRSVQHAGRYVQTPTGNLNEYDMTKSEGTVFTAGDKPDATTLNDLETRIGAGFAGATSDLNTFKSGLAQTLWTNANPGNPFYAQTVTLASSNYDELIIYFKTTTTSTSMKSVRILKGYGALLDYCAANTPAGSYVYFRNVTRTDDTHYIIYQCYYGYGDGTYGQIDENCIPITIKGVKY